MRFSWLEELVKEGQVSEKARDAIYTDCSELLKTADQNKEMLVHGIQQFLGNLGGLVMAGGAVAGTGVLMDRMVEAKSRKLLNETKQKLLAQPDLQEHAEQAEARFRELAEIAPSVAMNPNVAGRFVRSRLHSGLSEADVEKLTHIQATYTPDYLKQRRLTPKTASAADGELLADLYALSKTAAVDFGKVKNFLKAYGTMAMIPVGIGVGSGAVKELQALRDRKKMESALTKSFNDAMKLSDPVNEPLHENKEKARQAFQALVHFAPHVATQPQAARAFMNKIVSYDQGMNIGDIKDLSEIEKNLKNVKTESPFLSGLVKGIDFGGLKQLTQDAVGTVSGPELEALESDMAASLGMELSKPRYTYG